MPRPGLVWAPVAAPPARSRALLLVDGSFGGLPAIVNEGCRVIGTVERLANLFSSKTVYVLLIAAAVSVAERL